MSNPVASTSTHASIAAKAASLINDSAGAEPSPDDAAASPVTGGASGADSASAGAASPAPSDTTADETEAPASPEAPTTEHDILAEKLAEARAANRARREAKRLRDERARLKRDQDEAASARAEAEKARTRWAELGKSGSILETIKEAGRDPKEVFEALKNEAIRAGTPEAQIEALQAKFARELSETVEPLKKTIEQITKEAEQAKASAARQRFEADFQRVVADDAFGDLRDEYGDGRLLGLVRSLANDTDGAVELATAHGVRLTAPEKGLTMREILATLAAVQAAHVAEAQKRRAQRTAPAQQAPAPTSGTKASRVNGTADTTKAAKTIGNDLATSTATGSPTPARGHSSHARIAEKARRLIG